MYSIGKKDIKKASKVLAGAFEGDPDIRVVVPEDDLRKKQSKFFFEFFIRYGILYGKVISPSKAMEGVSVWLPSEYSEMSFLRSFRSGMLKLMRKISARSMRKFSEYGNDMDREHKEIMGDREHWQLLIIGVGPDHRGKGYGKMMIEHMLPLFDKDRLPCFLDSNRENNLSFYRKFGFQVVKEYTSIGNRHWGMVREPDVR